MSMGDKIKNKADELLGKGKETGGETANNNELGREGQACFTFFHTHSSGLSSGE